MKLNTNQVGLIVGIFAAVMHAVWSLVVFFGWAQVLMNWVFGLHFLINPYKVARFDITTALFLIVFTFVVGYLFGWLFATIWNRISK